MVTGCINPDQVPFNPIASAPGNAELTIAFAGIVGISTSMLLALSMGKRRAVSTRALALSIATLGTFLVATHVFNHIAGGNMAVACRQAWSHEMIAAGLLSMGAITFVGDIWWLIAAHLGTEPIVGRHRREVRSLAVLLSLFMHGLTFSVAVNMASTAKTYLDVWSTASGRPTPGWILWALVAYPLCVVALMAASNRYARTKNRSAVERSTSFRIAVFNSVVYTVVADVCVTLPALVPESLWTSPSFGLPVVTMAFALLGPLPTLIGVICAVPRLSRSAEGASPVPPQRSGDGGPASPPPGTTSVT